MEVFREEESAGGRMERNYGIGKGFRCNLTPRTPLVIIHDRSVVALSRCTWKAQPSATQRSCEMAQC